MFTNEVLQMNVDESDRSLCDYGNTSFHFNAYSDHSWKDFRKEISPHWHRELQFSYQIEGKSYFHVDGNQYKVTAGEAIFFNSRCRHSYVVEEGRLISFVFGEDFIAPFESKIYRNTVRVVTESPQKVVFIGKNNGHGQNVLSSLRILDQAVDEKDDMREQDVYSSCLLLWKAFCTSYLPEFSREGHEYKKEDPSYQRTRAMLHFMHKEYASMISLNDIAQEASISRSEALRCFHKVMGTTPLKYLAEYRLNRAKALLRNRLYKIEMIAASTGFSSPGYFCNVFKKATGLTPGEYREKMRISSHDSAEDIPTVEG